mmetsp:Transcript_53181/g.137582  ORF Transcript_53181/g.137582 Transcript_53181/m.137582 type:complete len:255 (-) Transcript_53181:175-939(-)
MPMASPSRARAESGSSSMPAAAFCLFPCPMALPRWASADEQRLIAVEADGPPKSGCKMRASSRSHWRPSSPPSSRRAARNSVLTPSMPSDPASVMRSHRSTLRVSPPSTKVVKTMTAVVAATIVRRCAELAFRASAKAMAPRNPAKTRNIVSFVVKLLFRPRQRLAMQQSGGTTIARASGTASTAKITKLRVARPSSTPAAPWSSSKRSSTAPRCATRSRPMYMKTNVSARCARLLRTRPTAAAASSESVCTWY